MHVADYTSTHMATTRAIGVHVYVTYTFCSLISSRGMCSRPVSFLAVVYDGLSHAYAASSTPFNDTRAHMEC
jgi:hypothetical protein